MAEYRFLTTWVVEAAREPVWDALWDSARWTEWWPGVIEAAEIEPGDERGIGRRGRYCWRSRIPYPVRFEIVSTRVEPHHLLEGRASGELAGVGRWRLYEQDGERLTTAVLYEWNVSTTRAWMNALAPLAAPLFRWNHDQVMAAGGRGLAGLLGTRLLVAS